jgi:hypothetical protein
LSSVGRMDVALVCHLGQLLLASALSQLDTAVYAWASMDSSHLPCGLLLLSHPPDMVAVPWLTLPPCLPVLRWGVNDDGGRELHQECSQAGFIMAPFLAAR